MNKRIISAVFCLFLILGLLPGFAQTAAAQSDTLWQFRILWVDFDDHYHVRPDTLTFHLRGMNEDFQICTEEVTIPSVCDKTIDANAWLCSFDTSEAPFSSLDGIGDAVHWDLYYELPEAYAIGRANADYRTETIYWPTGVEFESNLVTSKLEATVFDAYTHEMIGPAEFRLYGTSVLGHSLDLSESSPDGVATFAYSDWEDEYDRIPVGDYMMSVDAADPDYVIPDLPVPMRLKYGLWNDAIRQFFFVAKQDKYHDLTVGKQSSESDVEYDFTVSLKSKLFIFNPIGKNLSEIGASLSMSEVTWKKLDAEGNLIESGGLSNCTHQLAEDDFWDAVNALTPEEMETYRLKPGLYGNHADDEYTCVNAEETFKLKSGETIVFENLMEGTTFTVEETPLEGYQTTVEGQTDGEISSDVAVTFNNNRLIDISGSKTWDDADDKDGIRPESITVRLYADGIEKESAVVTAPDWSWTFTGLPKNGESGPINYVVEEDPVEGYTASVDGFNITNTHETSDEDTIGFTVSKRWIDQNDRSGFRPARVTVELYADGEPAGQSLVLSAEEGWIGSFSDLPKFRDGVAIVYSVREKGVPAVYTVSYQGSVQEGSIVITNEEKPSRPPFFEFERELPKTGITLPVSALSEQPASVKYLPTPMSLQIPSLDLVMDIRKVGEEDGAYPVEWLGMDAGLLEGTALPGEGPAVLVGHNTLNQEDFGPFVRIGMMNKGDRFFIAAKDGSMMAFEVYANEKIGSADVSGLYELASQYGSTVTLMTCEDELPEGGYASRRVIIGKQVL